MDDLIVYELGRKGGPQQETWVSRKGKRATQVGINVGEA